MSMWETITWDVARAGGFTAYILLTLAVALGLALTLQFQSPRWPRLINSELHNYLTLLSLIFVGVHVLAVWVDPFTRFGWNEVFIPLASHYRAVWMALGIVALYLGLAIGLSTWVRPLIGYALWRRLHVLTLLIYGLVTVHGLGTGSDSRTWWGVLLYVASVALIAFLLLMRLLMPLTPRAQPHVGWAALVSLLLLVGTIWALLGPLRSGWNASANSGAGSGQHSSIQAPAASGTASTASTSALQLGEDG
jgi:predicted ferric reductase